MEKNSFNKPTSTQIVVTIIALGIASFIEAGSNFINSLNPPSTTISAILLDTIGLLVIGFILGVPVTMLIWNRLVSPIFNISKIKYSHALVIVTAIYWINGL